ncbi:hypothetical protein EV714DRAFT_237367 [Schizophyllum commune]
MSFARRPSHKRSISLDIELQEIEDPVQPSKHIDESFRRVQIHVTGATGLPSPSRSATKAPAAYVRVQSAEFDNTPVTLNSSVASRSTDPTWGENLTAFLTRTDKQISLAVYHRAAWPGKHVQLCYSEPFTIDDLLNMPGADSRDTPLALDMNLSIPQSLGSPMPKLFINAREIASQESALVAINRSKARRLAAMAAGGKDRTTRLIESENLRRGRSVSVSFADVVNKANETTSEETVSSVVTLPQ